MREILFRGKRDKRYSKKEEWVYGAPYTDHSGDCIITGDSFSRVVYPETVGEFTGMTDRNGKKIFEGDILSAHLDELFPDDETKLVVVWHNNGWYGRNSKNIYDDFIGGFNKKFEVIGNVHDNQEMVQNE